ncbi:hypothetical protein STHU_42160 [Allostella humosa]|uniref:calcium-binding protein n=1 Tax=Stella humosa TaxID=94 RepID=UPI0011333D31|nr:calcium-binding protein [Stella humosa]BBK33582.1 hypothetical protein STHU_42160 [Stella humosa]
MTAIEPFTENADSVDLSLVDISTFINVTDALGGNDSVTLSGGQSQDDNFTGGNGDDHIFGSDDSEAIFGGFGNDTLFGEDGDDVLNGGGDSGDDGTSLLYGGNGNDQLVGFGGNDTIWGGTEDDRVTSQGGDDLIYGGAGADSITAGAGNDTVWGDDGDDRFLGGGDNDVLHGGNGNDRIDAESGHDTLWGDDGDDTLLGNGGDDLIEGGQGNDSLSGSTGNDTFFGSLPDLTGDTIADFDTTGATTDRIDLDTIFGADTRGLFTATGGLLDLDADSVGDVSVTGSDGTTWLRETDTLSGHTHFKLALTLFTKQADSVDLDSYDFGNVVQVTDALGGDDWVTLSGSQAGDDSFTGGDGNDHISGSDDLESIFGGNGADTLSGDAGADTLDGGADADLLYGGNGADRLIGGGGKDRLGLGAGEDSVVGSLADLSGDTVLDFDTGGLEVDRIVLDTIFGSDSRGLFVADGDLLDLDGNGTGDLSVTGADGLGWRRETSGGQTIFTLKPPLFTDGADTIDLDTVGFDDFGNVSKALAGNDRVTLNGGEARDDVFDAGNGNDLLVASSDAETIAGGRGEDTIWGTAADLADDLVKDLDGGDRIFVAGGSEELADFLDGRAFADLSVAIPLDIGKGAPLLSAKVAEGGSLVAEYTTIDSQDGVLVRFRGDSTGSNPVPPPRLHHHRHRPAGGRGRAPARPGLRRLWQPDLRLWLHRRLGGGRHGGRLAARRRRRRHPLRHGPGRPPVRRQWP